MDALIEVDHIEIAHADAARRNALADFARLVRAVNAIERVVIALVEIERTRAARVVIGAGKRAKGVSLFCDAEGGAAGYLTTTLVPKWMRL